FEESTVARIASSFQVLLESAAADPDQRVSDLALLPEAERRRILLEWNATDVEHAWQGGVHQLFEAQAARTPDALAVVDEGPRHLVRLDGGERDQIAQELASNPPGVVAASNLVYTIFTSGSTGRPKGVAVEHRQLVNYVRGVVERLALPAAAHYATVS